MDLCDVGLPVIGFDERVITDFDAQAMFDQGFIKNIELPIKVLAFGTIDKAINVKVNAISEKAKAMIEAAGGKVEIV